MEYAAFLSVMNTRQHVPGYMISGGQTIPLAGLRKDFVTGQT